MQSSIPQKQYLIITSNYNSSKFNQGIEYPRDMGET
jgi:hypothetical protein